MRDSILRRFTRRLDALAEIAPDKMTEAICIIVSAGKDRDILVISDPDTSDVIRELMNYASDPETENHPLAELLASRIRL